jgi:hypothetical protein
MGFRYMRGILIFFKLCVYDCGRLLRVDDFTLDKVRFDYARVLLSTSSFDILNTEAKVLVDGELFDFKIIEEWGFSLGEDACLSDEEVSQTDDEIQLDGAHEDVAGSGDVDALMNSLSAEWQKEETAVPVRVLESSSNMVTAKNIGVQKAGITCDEQDASVVRKQSHGDVLATVQNGISSKETSEEIVFNTVAAPCEVYDAPEVTKQFPEAVTSPIKHGLLKVNARTEEDRSVSKTGLVSNGDIRERKRTSSCPPGAHSSSAGPWSLDWLNNRHGNVNDAGRPLETAGALQNNIGAPRYLKKKGSDNIRNCAQNLKRIARLSDKDRKDVLRALRKTYRRRKGISKELKDKALGIESSSQSGSQASVNNDWTHWLVLQGSDKVRSEDVRGIREKVGLNFKGDKNNMFDVLSGVGRKKSEGGGGAV